MLEWALIFHNDTLLVCWYIKILHTSQGQPWKAEKQQGAKRCLGAATWVGACLSVSHIHPAAVKGGRWMSKLSCPVLWQSLLLQPITSQVLLCHRIIPMKPEAVCLVLGFGSLAHTLASEKAYQQFHLRLFPALLNHSVMSSAQTTCLCFLRFNMICSPSPRAFSSYLARK